MTARLQFTDGVQLVVRQQVAAHLIDANLACDSLCGVCVVSGQHQSLDAEAVQFLNGHLAGSLDRIGHREQGNHLSCRGQGHDRFTLALQLDHAVI